MPMPNPKITHEPDTDAESKSNPEMLPAEPKDAEPKVNSEPADAKLKDTEPKVDARTQIRKLETRILFLKALEQRIRVQPAAQTNSEPNP